MKGYTHVTTKAIGILNDKTSVQRQEWRDKKGNIKYTYITRTFVSKGKYTEKNWGDKNPLGK